MDRYFNSEPATKNKKVTKRKSNARQKSFRDRLRSAARTRGSASRVMLALVSYSESPLSLASRLPATTETLQRFAGISRSTFFDAMNKLESAGAIDTKPTERKRRNWPRGGGDE